MATTTGAGGSRPSTYDIAASLIEKLGGNPHNAAMVRAVAIWLSFESGTIYGNNPWNIRGTGPCGGHHFGSNGPFKTYCSLDEGIADTARLLSINQHGYPAIKAAVRANNPVGFLTAVYKSKWCHSATQTYCYNNGRSLLNAYAGSLTYKRTPTYKLGSPTGVKPAVLTDNIDNIDTAIGKTISLAEYAGISPDRNDNLWDVVKALITASDTTPGYGGKIAKDLIAQGLTGSSLIDAANAVIAYLVRAGGLDLQVLGVPTTPGFGTKAGDILIPITEDGHIDIAAINSANQAASSKDFFANAADFFKSATDAVGFIADSENWLLVIGFGAGVIITGWALKNLFGAQLGYRKPTVETTVQTKPGKKPGEIITRSRAKQVREPILPSAPNVGAGKAIRAVAKRARGTKAEEPKAAS